MQAQAPDPFLQREILGGEFRILDKIGTGGMGSVYRAAQPAMSRMVAIIHPSMRRQCAGSISGKS